MSLINASFPRDNNRVPITYNGITSADSQILTGNNTTVAVPIFTITGIIYINALYGVVTTALGNNTAAYFRMNDGTTQNNITLNTGTTLTNSGVGSLISKKGLAASALSVITSTSGKIGETTANQAYFQPFEAQENPLAKTNIEFVYSTTDAPTTGAISFYLQWIPLTPTGSVTPL